MNLEVFFKRGLLVLLIFFSLISVVSAAHTVDVQLINYTSFYETQNANFSLILEQTFNSTYPDFIRAINISIPTSNLNIISYDYPSDLDCSNNPYNSNPFVINCTGVKKYLNKYLLNITAKVISIDSNIEIDTFTVDELDSTNKNTVQIILYNDNSPPVLDNIIPLNNTFTNNLSRYFSIDTQDIETGIDKGDLSYFKCGDTVYKNESMICDQANCNSTLDISSYNSGDDLCYYFSIYNKGGSVNQTDLFLLNIDRSGPQFDLTYLEKLNNTNDEDGILEFNFSLSDEIGVKNCSLFLSNGSDIKINTTLIENITYDVSSTNNSYSFYIQCYDNLGNSNQTPTYRIYHDKTLPTIDSLVCDPQDNQNGNGNVLCNITVSDITGIDSCSLYINDILFQKLTGANIANNFSTIVPASNSNYSRYLKCNDSAGNEIITNKTYFYFDNIAPIITNNQTSVAYNSATITWNTNELANSIIDWDDNLALTKSVNSPNNVTSHSLTINSLNETSAYYYQIFSTDVWGNTAFLVPSQFTTSLTPPAGPGSGPSGGGSGSCTADWNCTEYSNCQQNGIQTRSCTDLNKCKNPLKQEVTEQACTYYPPTETIEPQSTETPQEVQPAETQGSGELITGGFITDLKNIKPISWLWLLAIIIAISLLLLKKRYPRIDPRLVEKDIMNSRGAKIPQKSPVQNKSVNEFMNNYRKGNLKKF